MMDATENTAELAPLEIAVSHDPTINYAFQQNAIPILRELRLANASGEERRDLLVTITAEPEFALPCEIRIQSLPPDAEHRSGPLDLKLSPRHLGGLTERVRGFLHIDVLENGAPLQRHTSEIALLAPHEWCGLVSLPEILAAFVLPNDPAVMQLLDGASDLLRQHTGRPDLNGYQDKNKKRAWQQVAAIYSAISARGIRYIHPPASFEQTGQKVRFPGEILEQRFGTCLDLALLFAACCEQCGLHPLVLLNEGHAYAGCWLEERTLRETALDDPQTIRKLVELDEIAIFETVAVTHETSSTLDRAELLAKAHLEADAEFRLALDVKRARSARILPLPIPGAEKAAAEKNEISPASSPGLGMREFSAASSPEAEIERPREANRIDQWKTRLLDLSLRNRLLNFRPTLGTMRILCPDPEQVEDELAANVELRLQPRPQMMSANDPRDPAVYVRQQGEDPLGAHLREELAQGRLHTPWDAAEHHRRLTGIFRSARLSLEENGANTLYAAVGFLEWRETEHSDRRHRAPLLLIPVELRRKSVLEGFCLRRLDEETRLNITLLEMLRREFQKEVPGIDPLPEEEKGVNVGLVFRRFQEAVRDLPGWEVKREIWLGQFSFTKFLLWKDLNDRIEDLSRNRVVGHLVNGPGAEYPNPPEDIVPAELDDRVSPAQVYCPRSVDSSQLAAILAAAAGHDFVLEGPPGTGKSQTITNLISHCLAEGKRVLFVAEKRAALDVVYRRLKEEGLDPFCLELHSNKSGKSEVLAQFKQALDVAALREPGRWERRAQELQEVRDQLNGYVRALHRNYPCGLSAFDCFDYLLPRRESPVIKLELASLLEESPEELEARRIAASRLADRAAPFASAAEHPLRELHGAEWSPGWEEDVRTKMADLKSKAAGVEPAIQTLRLWLRRSSPGASRREIETLDALAALLLHPQPAGPELLTGSWDQIAPDLEKWQALAEERMELRRKLDQFEETPLLALDLQEIEGRCRSSLNTWFLPRIFRLWKIRRELSTARKDGKRPRVEELLDILGRARRLGVINEIFNAAAAFGNARLGAIWRHGEPVPEEISAARTWGEQVRAQLASLAGEDLDYLRAVRSQLGGVLEEGISLLSSEAPLGLKFDQFKQSWAAFEEAWESFASATALETRRIEAAEDFLGASRQLFADIERGWRDLRYWCAWQKARAEAIQLGLAPLISAIEQGEAPAAEARDWTERSLRRALLNAILERDEILRQFFGREQEGRLLQFRELDRKVTELTRDLIRARLAAKVPRENTESTSPKSELGLLRKEIGKRARHIPVRQLLGRIRTLLPSLKPCLLMSPLSIAQYLEPSHEHFDIVIFDEASQIPVWDAVGAIARGAQLVVVGDPKQLPPTNFFNRADSVEAEEEEESAESEDLESILDELLSHGLRHKRLQWHYRSRHESLITFSNREYYQNQLLTFPSPHVGHQGVNFRFVESATYDKGRSRTNRGEAEALVSELVRRLRHSEGAKRSYGVVTFSQAQQALVENLLDEQRRKFPEIETHFGDGPPVEGEPVFIKNLENVQGDERDVILFSICYGPDKAGRISMNFGPLNRDGGERRLNVAITRAKHEVVVFTGLRGDQIDLTRTRARGVRDLKNFLDYAERGPRMLAGSGPDPDAVPDSEFERMVAERLRAAGYEVHRQVGCSGYRINLAVVDPAHPDRYLLGIECDGSTYHRAATARDRDVLRQSVLEGLGWRLHRIWATDWWHDSERQLEYLLRVIQESTAARRTG